MQETKDHILRRQEDSGKRSFSDGEISTRQPRQTVKVVDDRKQGQPEAVIQKLQKVIYNGEGSFDIRTLFVSSRRHGRGVPW